MRMSEMFSRTLREVPVGAESRGYEFLLRAGYIKQVGAGIFTLLPLGFKSTRKIERIIREEMNYIGGQEMLMPVVNPADIWKETGRYYQIDKEMSRFKDRNGRDMVLAMTHEEAVTDAVKAEIDSYKKLPLLVYQIQTKWRDDPRPRAGLIRVREFTMLDSYSLDRDFEGLEKQYKAHYDAYFKIFARCCLPVVVVGADPGMMGGKVSHEYMYLTPIGEDTVIECKGCGYIANKQAAVFDKEIKKDKAKPMEKVKTPHSSTIKDLAEYLKIETKETAKCVFMVGSFAKDDGEKEEKLVVALVRGDLEIEEAKLSNAAKAISLRPAHEEEITACKMVPGYASPIGAAGNFITIVDDSVASSSNLVAGANEQGYHFLNTNFGRDYNGIVADIASAAHGSKCANCGYPLTSSKGIEVGNIFQLGTRYSSSMKATYQDEKGEQRPIVMGSYGIGVGRLLACVAEEHSDEKGLALPVTIAPYEIHLVSLLKDKETTDKIYTDLLRTGYDVLYDDRDESAGVKFADADLIGLPFRITIGARSLRDDKAEVKYRRTGEEFSLPLSTLDVDIREIIMREMMSITVQSIDLGF